MTFVLRALQLNVSSMRRWQAFIVGAIGLLSMACRANDSNVVRGRGLRIAAQPPPVRAQIYEAAARGAFELDESLSLLLDPRMLPRDVGLGADGRVPGAVFEEMKRRGVIRGTCEPPLQGLRGVPRCPAVLPGYVLRYSPVFTLGPDSVQVYVYVQKYDTPGLEPSQTLRFERAYQIVRQGNEWRAVREGRVPNEARGEKQ
jgi:hypothetical protein